MNKILILQISLSVILAGAFSGLVVYTDVYQEIKSTIVETVCLSCIKMDPVTKIVFTFDTYDDRMHPDFVKDDLETGLVFLDFRSPVCLACNKMEPILKDVLNIEFEPQPNYHTIADYNDMNISFYHINRTVWSEDVYGESFFTYDVDNRRSVPMFVIITLGDNNGIIQPYFMTAYGELGLSGKSGAQKEFFKSKMIEPAVDYYNQYSASYTN